MTIAEFHARLAAAADEGSGLLAGLARLTRLPDPGGLAVSLNEALMWYLWRAEGSAEG